MRLSRTRISERSARHSGELVGRERWPHVRVTERWMAVEEVDRPYEGIRVESASLSIIDSDIYGGQAYMA